MLDKILGNKEKENNAPDLRKNEKDTGSNVSGRIRNMVSRAGDRSKDQKSKLKTNGDGGNEDPTEKIPRPMPKPRPKDTGRARLKAPDEKKPGGRPGGSSLDRLGGAVPGFGRRSPGGGRIPDDDQRTLVGALVFGIILIVLVGAGYYFLFYAPYQGSLQDAKNTKISEVNSYFKGALATDPQKLTLLAEIESAVTPEQALAVDVLGPATTSWRAYQQNQIETKKDPYGRVMLTYSSGDKKDLIMKVAAAQTLVTQSDASVLANVEITTPDTVVIPIRLDRLRAAGGLISVGDTVDIYVSTNETTTTTTTTTNETNRTNQTQQSTGSNQSGVGQSSNTPLVSGATVLAILRSMVDQNTFNASISTSQQIAINSLSQSASRSQSAGVSDTGIEALLQAGASRTWDETSINALLNAYGVRLDQFERQSNFGNLDAEYMVLLEVPRDKAIFLIQNSNAIQLTISTQSAPSWMVTELHKIYG
ncbi:MAG: DUF515 domain-containing protein [Methanobacteriaceae archaeon]|nr:DUF515 domain-containing protein [Methanobacteriaceae archaeon]